MWRQERDNSPQEEDSPRSHIACHACRKRKIRCDRELPHCTTCERTSQVCQYPARVLKPGPKLGSTHRKRKRRRQANPSNDDDDDDEEEDSAIGMEAGLSQDASQTAFGSRGATTALQHENDDEGARETITVQVARWGQSGPRMKDSNNNGGRTRHDSINMNDLSFILHPAHEVSTPEKNTSPISANDGVEQLTSVIIARASSALGVTPDVLDQMIKMYFNNMTAINIFHEPTFEKKVQNIGSPTQLYALLASLLAFAARFRDVECQDSQNYESDGLAGMDHPPSYFLGLASGFLEEALKECGDEAPPLCVLQAFVLLAHSQLTQGVRGKAWRSLGNCVRLAYELNLHLVDTRHPREVVNAKQWCEYEEKRRVWWAIWEMDVFASTIRRCPTAMNWSQIETLLPVDDEHWFTEKPHPSCFLESDLVRRWKALEESGNQSAKAWFIVVNSMMKEAQSITSPRGIPILSSPESPRSSTKSSKDQKRASAIAEEAKDKLEILSNSVRCFVMALPPSLKYRNQYLGFDARHPGQFSSLRQHHCGVYNIHVMTQLAKLMIHHYDVFGESARAGRTLQDIQIGKPGWQARSTSQNEMLATSQYFEAADEILHIIHRSSDDHIQWINNFLSSTVWLASAVQLVRKEFGPPGTNRALIKSKFEVLNMTYKKCVSFWDIQTAMQHNLETLESQLEAFRISKPCKQDQSPHRADRWSQVQENSKKNGSAHTTSLLATQNRANNVPGVQGMSNLSPGTINDNTRRPSSQSPPSFQNNPSSNSMFAAAPAASTQPRDENSSSQRQQQQSNTRPSQPQVGTHYLEPLSPALSALDFMNLQPKTGEAAQQQQQQSDCGASASPAFMNDQGDVLFAGAEGDLTQGMMFGIHMNGWNTELPSYIDGLLSGGYIYQGS